VLGCCRGRVERSCAGSRARSGIPEKDDEVMCPCKARVGFVGILLAGPVSADVS
jgi:hypothetical protein